MALVDDAWQKLQAQVPAAGTRARVFLAGLALLAALAAAGSVKLLSGSELTEETADGIARGSAGTTDPVERKKKVERPQIAPPEIAVMDGERPVETRTRIRVRWGNETKDYFVIRERKP